MRPTDPPHGTIPDDRSAADVVRSLFHLFLSRRGYDGPASDHFDGRRFRNPDGSGPRGLLGLLRWRLGRLLGGVAPWPSWTDAAPGPAPPRRVDGTALRVTLVNQATTLLQTAGVNVLTDPIWSER